MLSSINTSCESAGVSCDTVPVKSPADLGYKPCILQEDFFLIFIFFNNVRRSNEMPNCEIVVWYFLPHFIK